VSAAISHIPASQMLHHDQNQYLCAEQLWTSAKLENRHHIQNEKDGSNVTIADVGVQASLTHVIEYDSLEGQPQSVGNNFINSTFAAIFLISPMIKGSFQYHSKRRYHDLTLSSTQLLPLAENKTTNNSTWIPFP